jgi:hypothetical protein
MLPRRGVVDQHAVAAGELVHVLQQAFLRETSKADDLRPNMIPPA